MRQLKETVVKIKEISCNYRPERGEYRKSGMEQIGRMLKEIRQAESGEAAMIKAAIATGYVNGMYHGGLISWDELGRVVKIIEVTGTKAIDRIKNSKKKRFSFRKGKRWQQ